MSAVPALRRLTRVALVVPFVVASLEPFTGNASAQVAPLGARCPIGTTQDSTNIVVNGNYAILGGGVEPEINPAASFTSDLPYRGDAVYPDDRGVNGPLGPEGPRGGISIQTGPIVYANGVVTSRQQTPVFPGDPENGAPPSNTFLYSNPNEDLEGNFIEPPRGGTQFVNPTIWRQTVNVTPNTTYNFIAYFDNLLSATADSRAADPQIQLQLQRGNTPPVDLGPQIAVPRSVPNGLGGEWLPVQFSFTTLPTDTSITLSIVDRANTVNGDDFGHTAIGLRQCLPNIGIAKEAGTAVSNSDGTFTVPYSLTVRNYGADAITNLQVTDDLATTFANAAGFVVSGVQSPTLSVNPSFNGSSDRNILAAGNTLAPTGQPGDTATITFNVTITPGTGPQGFGPFNNSAIATGNAGNTTVQDTSDAGTNPDPNGNSIPNEPGENDPTPVTLPVTPKLGVAKQAGTVVDNGNGVFTVPYTVTVSNLGNVPVNNLQLVENLTTTFGPPSTFTIAAAPSSSTLTVNPTFNGNADSNLLAGTQTLAVGQSATVTFSVQVTANGQFGPFNNTVLGTGTGPGNTPVQDESTNGANPDPNGDTNPDENQPTPVSFNEIPKLGVAKQAGAVVDNGNGVFTVPYTVTVSNLGNVPVNNLQLVENLTTTFGPPTTFTIAAAPTSSTLAVNPGFNGNGNPNLLAGTTALAVGQSATVTFSVQVTANGQFGPFNNTVTGNGTGPGGTPVTDQSTNGTNPDPNGDTNPDENQPTPVSLTETSKLGVAKQAGAVVTNGNGVFTVPYTVTVSNLGNVPINNLQLVENLATTFGPPSTFTIAAAPNSPTLAVNPAFNGNSDPNLLGGTTTLAVGQTATVTFSVQVTTNGQPGPFNNTVTGSGTSPGGTPVTDQSTNGTNPDPNGDTIPDENQPTPVQPEPIPVGEPQLRLLKRITAVEQGGRTQTFDRFVDDPADPNDTAPGWSQLAPVGDVNLPTTLSLRSGDSVEYTFYFLSDGTTSATAASLCDPIPVGTTFARDRFGAGSGLQLNRASAEKALTNNADTDEGSFFTPLAPLPNGNACPANAQTNANGSVIVNLGEISNTPGQNFGFVRFQVRID